MKSPSDASARRRVHRFVERHTPDGTFGRGLLGGTALFSAPLLFLGGAAMLTGGSSVPAFVAGVFAFVLGVSAFPLGMLALWPVYLSLVGDVESPSAYPEGGTRPRAGSVPAATLERRYAAGDLSREEFERRLDDVMETPNAGGDSGGDDDRRTRPERSRNW